MKTRKTFYVLKKLQKCHFLESGVKMELVIIESSPLSCLGYKMRLAATPNTRNHHLGVVCRMNWLFL